MSILVVGPNVIENATLEAMLNEGGYPAVVSFTTVDEVLTNLGLNAETTRETPSVGMDLLLLNVGSHPEQLELIRKLKSSATGRDVPIVVLSQSDRADMLPMAFAYGASDYMTHPIEAPELIARVRASLILKHEIDRRIAREKELIEATRQLTDVNAWLSRLSVLDSLTKVANRRGFDTALEQEWRRAVRNQTHLALILIDVDYFKAYNDTYGHREGDACLTRVAQALKATVRRPGDTVARYGGEEFALILAETAGPGASYVAEKVRTHVEALAIAHSAAAAAPWVTVSVGVASLEPTQELSPEELLRQADAALYRAKESGRNRVVVWAGHDVETDPIGSLVPSSSGLGVELE